MYLVFSDSEIITVDRSNMELTIKNRAPLGDSLIAFWNTFKRYKEKDGQLLHYPSDQAFDEAVRSIYVVSDYGKNIPLETLQAQIQTIFSELSLSMAPDNSSPVVKALTDSLLLYVGDSNQISLDTYSLTMGVLDGKIVQVYDVTSLRQRLGLEYYFTFFGPCPQPIIECPFCHKWFRAIHGNALYCSSKCRNKMEKTKMSTDVFYSSHRNKQKYYNGRLNDLLSACEYDKQNPLYLHCQKTYDDCLHRAQAYYRQTIEYEKSRRGNEESLLLHQHFPYLPEVKSMPPTDHSKYDQDLKSIWGTFTAECKEAKKKCKKQ